MRTYSSIERELDELALLPKIEELNPGAMCYCPRLPDYSTKNFVCSKCNKATKYLEDTYKDIVKARKRLKSLKDIDIEVIDTPFCEHCSKGNQKEEFILHIHYPDRKSIVKSKIDLEDVNKLVQFLAGKKVYKDSGDNESDMKDYIPFLRKVLLGKKT